MTTEDTIWFTVIANQQSGPYTEKQLNDLILEGRINRDTLVWKEGMENWQKASEIQGLLPVTLLPPPVPSTESCFGNAQKSTKQLVANITPFFNAPKSANRLVVNVSIGSLIGRILLVTLCQFLVIPHPWVATGFCKWIVSNLRMPSGKQITFGGDVNVQKTIKWCFIVIALCSYVAFIPIPFLAYLVMPFTAFLGLAIRRWFVSHLLADGRLLPLKFTGEYWPYLGWCVLDYLSIFTIIGWAWVQTAYMRWVCRHVEGTTKKLVFTATGLEVLWRTVCFWLSCILIIPIPLTLHWYVKWFVSCFSVEDR